MTLPSDVPLPSTPPLTASHQTAPPPQFSSTRPREDSLQDLLNVDRNRNSADCYNESHDQLAPTPHGTNTDEYLLPHEKLQEPGLPTPLLPHEHIDRMPTFSHEEVNAEDVTGEVDTLLLHRDSVSAGPRRRSSTTAVRPASNTTFIPILPEALSTELSRKGSTDLEPDASARMRRISSAPHILEVARVDSIAKEEESVSSESSDSLEPIAEADEDEAFELPRRLSLPALHSFTDDPIMGGAKHVAFGQTSTSLPQSPTLVTRDSTWNTSDDDGLAARNSITIYDISNLVEESDFNDDGFPWREILETEEEVYLYPENSKRDLFEVGDEEDDWSDTDDEEDKDRNSNPWVTGSQFRRFSTSYFPGLVQTRTQTNAWEAPIRDQEEDGDSGLPDSIDPFVVEEILEDQEEEEAAPEDNTTIALIANHNFPTTPSPPTVPPNSHVPSDRASASPSPATGLAYYSPTLSPHPRVLPSPPPGSPQPPTHHGSDETLAEQLPAPPHDLPQRIRLSLGEAGEDKDATHFKAHKDSLELASLRLAKGRVGKEGKSEGSAGESNGR
ncbi:MAG: hypothetical protein M1821_001345 [Bathelium mastoideum]|nr:MAG: hypothetical protein M1821_001345 [Bathelium mastoideum]KAI9689870.1 MAG: hypothetical protein M1822_009752 [Bathelium mastoideum]